MMYNTQLAVEALFKTSWSGETHFSDTEKHPNADEWIYLDVEPIATDSGISGCVQEISTIYITVYAGNKVKSAQLADSVVAFLKGRLVLGSAVSRWTPITQGEVYRGLHFRKIAFDLAIWN